MLSYLDLLLMIGSGLVFFGSGSLLIATQARKHRAKLAAAAEKAALPTVNVQTVTVATVPAETQLSAAV